MIIVAIYVYFYPQGLQLIVTVLLTIILSIIGQIGDLVESALKRYYGVKDLVRFCQARRYFRPF